MRFSGIRSVTHSKVLPPGEPVWDSKFLFQKRTFRKLFSMANDIHLMYCDKQVSMNAEFHIGETILPEEVFLTVFLPPKKYIANILNI